MIREGDLEKGRFFIVFFNCLNHGRQCRFSGITRITRMDTDFIASNFDLYGLSFCPNSSVERKAPLGKEGLCTAETQRPRRYFGDM